MRHFLICMLIALLSLSVFSDEADDLVNGIVTAPESAVAPSPPSSPEPAAVVPALPKPAVPMQVQKPAADPAVRMPSEPSVGVSTEREPPVEMMERTVSSDSARQGRDVELSIRGGIADGGIHRPDGDGMGGYASLLIPCGESLDLRIGAFYLNMEDDVELSEQQYSGSVRLAFRMKDHNGFVPYVGAGALFHKVEWETARTYRYRYWRYRYSYTYRYDNDEDDTQPVVFAGVVRDGRIWHFRLDAAYVPEMYARSAQIDVQAEVGVKLGKSVRLDAGIEYFTEWETLLAGIGFTFLF